MLQAGCSQDKQLLSPTKDQFDRIQSLVDRQYGYQEIAVSPKEVKQKGYMKHRTRI